MAKKELFKIPLLGSAMKFLHVISVERGSASKAAKSLLEAIEIIKTGRNVIIFPEGTRSNDGHTLSPFKKGAFTIAKRAEVDVIPFIIEGTEKYMPKKANFNDFTDAYIKNVQHKINRRPREKLGFESPKRSFFRNFD